MEVLRCLSKRKDTNFKANHNNTVFVTACNNDVCLSAKIRILKQITTSGVRVIFLRLMFV